ncbi:hypothetical protein RF11_13227 [Thelohanellus kitauei]|uniref:Uncharacterized protein n=1 Tax=Thelohanellus kitauei TaxID=669202 RepID=A0A0C2MU64_THEKT|nr:hypothetical protein RF11_13227 [Thelohanellus kitauei]
MSLRSLKHESTKYSPIEIIYGRKPRLFTDLLQPFQPAHNYQNEHLFVTNLKKRLNKIYKDTRNNTLEPQKAYKMCYDRGANEYIYYSEMKHMWKINEKQPSTPYLTKN